MFVLIIGALNHWVTFVVHKNIEEEPSSFEYNEIKSTLKELREGNATKEMLSKLTKEESFETSKKRINMKNKKVKADKKYIDKLDFYLLDSSNSEHWSLTDDSVPIHYM